MTINYIRASLFDAPDHSILLHACNARGSWSAGIALAFKSRYPEAYLTYRNHCRTHTAVALVGTTQLIQIGDQKWIGCLFTSDRGGRYCDSPDQIIQATRLGLLDLQRQMKLWDASVRVTACKFNSGIFAVPWEQTAGVIQEVGLSMDVYVPESVGESTMK